MSSVTLAQIKYKQFDAARARIRQSNDVNLQNALDFAIAADQVERGDIDGALATARASADPNQRISLLVIIAGNVNQKNNPDL